MRFSQGVPHFVCAVCALGTALVSSIAPASACGVERWSVKTGTDADRNRINFSSATPVTIAQLRNYPSQSSPPSNNRIAPYETTLVTVDAILTQYKSESDQDYHLVIQDSAGRTVIAEIPAPSCCGSGSVFASGVANTRAEFDAAYSVSGSFKTTSVPVRIVGVPMYDFAHGQTGASPNQIEIHSVLDIQFNPTGGGSGGTGGGGGTATQLLGNPGFENGTTTAPWSDAGGAVSNSTSEPAHSSSWNAWLDGYGAMHSDTVSQSVTIPSSATQVSLSFYLHIDTAETTKTSIYDTLKVQVLGQSGNVLATLGSFSNLNAASGYSLKQYDLSSYIGQTITVNLVGSEDSTLQTSFVVDDFALNVK